MRVELLTRSVYAEKEAQLIKITAQVREAVRETGVQNGVVFVISAHTTAGITMNEGLPCVETDALDLLARLVPEDAPYAHAHFLPSYGTAGGNSPGHLKAMLTGNHCVLPLKDGELVLGHAQDLYFAEFDGIKSRTYYIQVLGE